MNEFLRAHCEKMLQISRTEDLTFSICTDPNIDPNLYIKKNPQPVNLFDNLKK